MSPAERGALLVLLGLAVAGQAARLALGGSHHPGAVLADSALEAHQARSENTVRPLRAGEQIDADVAPAEELARLPGIGMRLAKQVVEDRELRGPFGSPAALGRVRGIGPATVRRLEPFLRFSPRRDAADPRVALNVADSAALTGLPGIGPALARAILAYRERHGPFAELKDLERVPGIGPAKVRRLAPLVRVP